MTVKRKPHHDLGAVQAKFADADSLEITGTAARMAQALGYSLQDVVDVVQALEAGDSSSRERRIIRPTIACGTTPTSSRLMTCICI